jgi:hypothetical protein
MGCKDYGSRTNFPLIVVLIYISDILLLDTQFGTFLSPILHLQYNMIDSQTFRKLTREVNVTLQESGLFVGAQRLQKPVKNQCLTERQSW